MTGRGDHLGDRLAALVDGVVAEPERSRLLTHLAHCPECRAEFDAQRTVKGLLGDLTAPPAPPDLAARLAGLASAPAPPPPPTPAARIAGRARAVRPVSARQRVVAASAAALVVVGGGLAVTYVAGSAPSDPPVHPPVDRFVREHAAVTGGVPLLEPELLRLPGAR